MKDLKINTDIVVIAADNIKNNNTQMRDGFADVQKVITKLDGYWEGAAATAAIKKFHEIKNTFCEARYNVLDNYVNFLHQQINDGYTQTENANVSLADQFK